MSDFLSTFLSEDKIDLKGVVVNRKIPVIQSVQPGQRYLNKDDAIHIKFRSKSDGEVEEIIVGRFKKTVHNILNKSIILYGPSGTGKTTIIKDFLYLLQMIFPTAWGFLPTNAEKHDFDNILKRPLIYEAFGLEEVENVYLRQKAAAEIYNNANDLKILDGLFQRIADAAARNFLQKLLYMRNKAIDEASRGEESESAKKERVTDIQDVFKDRLVKFYKQVINSKINRLKQMNLSKEEQYALQYRYFNPRTCIIFDDAYTEIMSMLKEGRKKNKESIKNFFFKGRWAYITHIYGFQDDNRLDSEIRKGAFHSIFTDKQTAMGFFSRQANGFTPSERKRAETVIGEVFSKAGVALHRKLVYSRLDRNPFYYIIADEHADVDIKMCSKATKAFCDFIQNHEKFNTDNPFHKEFADI
jgi:hypothetical protein